MPIIYFLGLIIFALLLAAGQVLFKAAALSAPPLQSFSAMLALLQVPAIWAALLLYACSTLLWIYLMQHVPLSRGYPFAALGFVLVPAAGVMLFHERISGLYVAGAILVAAGLILISRA